MNDDVQKQTVVVAVVVIVKAGLRHRPTIGHGLGPRGFRGPALSKVKEMCRHSYYSLSHEKSEKCFGLLPVLCIRVCLLKREAVVPHKIFWA